MIEGLVVEPNCYAEQTLRGEGLEVEISVLSVAGRHCWGDEGLPRTDCRHGAHHHRKHGKVLEPARSLQAAIFRLRDGERQVFPDPVFLRCG